MNPSKSFLLGSIIHTKTKMCNWAGLNKTIADLKSKTEKGMKVSSPYTALTIFDEPSIHFDISKIWAEEHKKEIEYEKEKKKNRIRKSK